MLLRCPLTYWSLLEILSALITSYHQLSSTSLLINASVPPHGEEWRQGVLGTHAYLPVDGLAKIGLATEATSYHGSYQVYESADRIDVGLINSARRLLLWQGADVDCLCSLFSCTESIEQIVRRQQRQRH